MNESSENGSKRIERILGIDLRFKKKKKCAPWNGRGKREDDPVRTTTDNVSRDRVHLVKNRCTYGKKKNT